MKHGSLFSGIGGFDLAADWMGWTNVFHCECNPFCQKVLKHYWPKADSHTDITKTDFTRYENSIEIISGGFPCQPFSLAGKRKGKSDERYLWDEMFRAICEIKPKFVVAENVYGITNIDGGLVFEKVCIDLENQGYEVQPFVIPAAAKNAPHRRDRVWFVATNAMCNRINESGQNGQSKQFDANGIERTIFADANSNGQHERNGNDENHTSKRGINAQYDTNKIIMHTNGTSEPGKYINQPRKRQFDGPNCKNEYDNFQNFPTQSPICGGNDGLPGQLDGITFSKWRQESIKGYGNAICPQIAFTIFQTFNYLN